MGLLYHGSCALASHSVVWLLGRLGNLSLVSFYLLASIFVDDFPSVLLSVLRMRGMSLLAFQASILDDCG